MAVEIKKIGVIGAGQMGSGIAHVCALAGFDVGLSDISMERIESGLASINGNMARQVSKSLIAEDERNAALDRIKPIEELDLLADADLVIESAVENEQVKRKIFAQLCPILKPEAILATNTSSISITRLAATTDRPERFIGIHFMNPVPIMELVELVRGIATEDETFEASKGFCTRLGKQIAVAEDFPGLHGQPHLAPDDQRSDLHALRRRRFGGVDRQGHASWRKPSDGSRCSWPTSSVSTPAFRSCRCFTRALQTPSIVLARFW